ncbi:hypothetical protein [Blastopirellula marina]|uniref:Uncharacterized protein n=1 Tax=Blastopirellula marina TaxID=124 RepID=A0A2S8GGL1_9BACT|nr:hypothetical protein [Blastopirellula marina]PQO40128.1 hypothetical protein C5Y98_05850 [Blastopirellula marina]PQO43602.1 hypothetical protein C5Y93_23420 [Blastopirellula marina]PTL45495.1 hypothetical protein C5Y97_05850 [Blastopirellula marina]
MLVSTLGLALSRAEKSKGTPVFFHRRVPTKYFPYKPASGITAGRRPWMQREPMLCAGQPHDFA